MHQHFRIHIFCLLIVSTLCLPTTAQDRTSETSLTSEKSVREGINDDFKNPNLSVEDFLKRFEVESREVYSKRNEILAVLDIKPGEHVIDLGAGTGFYTFLFAEKVGSKGQVLALDIAPAFVESILGKANERKLPQVQAKISGDVDFEATPNRFDLVFLCDVYHHLEYPHQINRRIFESLKNGGRLVIIDFKRVEGVSREWVINHVRAGAETVRAEVEASGLEFVAIDNELLEENYIMSFRKP